MENWIWDEEIDCLVSNFEILKKLFLVYQKLNQLKLEKIIPLRHKFTWKLKNSWEEWRR